MRNIKIAPGEYYHVFNRGVRKQALLHDRGDYIRFLFLILYFQSPKPLPHINRRIKEFASEFLTGQHSVLAKEQGDLKDRKVELVAFCLMPNHFHLVIKEVEESGISAYMQRVLNAYAKYYNTKYEKSGHVFQGPYRAVHVENDRQLMYLSAYIHRNPREIERWRSSVDDYPWSTYTDFISNNRWGNLIKPDIVTERFSSARDYKKFVESSTAKLLEEELTFIASGQHSVLAS